MFLPLRNLGDEENVLYSLKPLINDRRFLCEICRNHCKTKCASCKSSYYCSRDCQRKDWEVHRKVCPSLKKHYEYQQFQRATHLTSSRNGFLSVSLFKKMDFQERFPDIPSYFFHRIQTKYVLQHEFGLKTPVLQVRKWLSEKMGSSSMYSFEFSDYVEEDTLVEDIPICKRTGMRFISLFDWKAYDVMFRKQGLIRDANYLNEKMMYHYFEIPLPAPRRKEEFIRRRRDAGALFKPNFVIGMDNLFQRGIMKEIFSRTVFNVFPFEELINLRSEAYRNLQNLLFFGEEGSRESIFDLMMDSPNFAKEMFETELYDPSMILTISKLFNYLIGCCYYLDSLAEGLMICKKSEEFINRFCSSELLATHHFMEILLQTHMFSAKMLMMVLEFSESRKHIEMALKLTKEQENDTPHPKYHLFNREGVRKLEDDVNSMETEYLRCQQSGDRFERDKFDFRLRRNPKSETEKGKVRCSQVERFIVVRRIKRRYYEEMMDLRSRVFFLRNNHNFEGENLVDQKKFFKTISLVSLGGVYREIKVLNLLFLN